MNNVKLSMLALALSGTMLAVPVSTTSAAPLGAAASPLTSSMALTTDGLGNVINVQSRAERRAKRRANRSKRRANRANRRANRANPRANRSWRGHRGYRGQRRGYRRHSDGWWYPLAAFGALATGAAIANSANRGDRHVEWCQDNYRSYRISDDTFQPYNGPRKRCNSPYD